MVVHASLSPTGGGGGPVIALFDDILGPVRRLGVACLIATTSAGCPSPAEPDDSAFAVADDYGQLVLRHRRGVEGTYLEIGAVFHEIDADFPRNHAKCRTLGGGCVQTWPGQVDVLVEVPPASGLGYSPAQHPGVDVGDPISVAGVELGHDPGLLQAHGLIAYRAPQVYPAPLGRAGLRFDGAWGVYDGVDDVALPQGFAPSSPRGFTHDPLSPNQAFPIRWEPGGEGDVYLEVSTLQGDRHWFALLEDDGVYDLIFDELGLHVDLSYLHVGVGRQRPGTVPVNDRSLQTLTQSITWYDLVYLDKSERTQAPLFNTCAQAMDSEPLPVGSYHASLAGFGNSRRPGSIYDIANGVDGVFRLQVPPWTTARVRYLQPGDRASIYRLMLDCDGPRIGAYGVASGWGQPAELEFRNESALSKDAFIILDAFSIPGTFAADDAGLHTLTIDVELR
jgi:hypothetical protein